MRLRAVSLFCCPNVRNSLAPCMLLYFLLLLPPCPATLDTGGRFILFFKWEPLSGICSGRFAVRNCAALWVLHSKRSGGPFSFLVLFAFEQGLRFCRLKTLLVQVLVQLSATVLPHVMMAFRYVLETGISLLLTTTFFELLFSIFLLLTI